MAVPSPCKLICRYDEDGLCVGCRRNKDEITDWINMTDQQKLEVYRKIKVRKTGQANG
jgi:predicted Fe-S protein YdhL (DUF1289 family)